MDHLRQTVSEYKERRIRRVRTDASHCLDTSSVVSMPVTRDKRSEAPHQFASDMTPSASSTAMVGTKLDLSSLSGTIVHACSNLVPPFLPRR